MRKRGYQTIALLMGLTMLTACSRSEGKPPRADLEIRPLVLEYCETCTKAVWPNTDDYKVSVGPPFSTMLTSASRKPRAR